VLQWTQVLPKMPRRKGQLDLFQHDWLIRQAYPDQLWPL
jgi:hypothetical protein